ncbi:MAG: hypothetical protein ACRD96_28415, partial [Bryobacteraceae bacterium]
MPNAADWLNQQFATQLAAAVEGMAQFRPEPKTGTPVSAGDAVATEGVAWTFVPLLMEPGTGLIVGATERTLLALGAFALK